MNVYDSEPCFMISIAARMIGVQTHTLRYYERAGLVGPARSQGNVRLYSEQDVERLRQIKTLIDDLGVNLAGVEVILRLLDRIAEVQRQMEEKDKEIERLKGERKRNL